jgi:hypothetical protein
MVLRLFLIVTEARNRRQVVWGGLILCFVGQRQAQSIVGLQLERTSNRTTNHVKNHLKNDVLLHDLWYDSRYDKSYLKSYQKIPLTDRRSISAACMLCHMTSDVIMHDESFRSLLFYLPYFCLRRGNRSQDVH